MAKAPRKPESKTAKAAPKGAAKAASPTGKAAGAAQPKKPEILSKPGASALKPGRKAAAKPAAVRAAVQPEIVEPGEEKSDFSPADPDAPDFSDMEPIEIDPDEDILEVEAQKKLPVMVPEIVEPSDSKALAATDPVATYLAEIRKYPLLTREQENELAIRYRESGDARAAEMLVTSNLRFVVKVAAEYSRFGAKLIDLIQEGNVGLMHAVKEFNPYKGVRLITYAVWWIRGYIQEYLMRQYSMVRIGTTQNQRKLFYRLQKEREALGALGQEPTYALLAGRLGVTEEEVETMTQRLAGRDLSLSAPVDANGNSTATLLDYEASGETPVDDTIGHLEEMEVLKENLEKIRPDLNAKETYVLEKRILADDPMTLQEIGEHFGVTREAVRQLEARIIGRIRAAVIEKLGETELGDEE